MKSIIGNREFRDAFRRVVRLSLAVYIVLLGWITAGHAHSLPDGLTEISVNTGPSAYPHSTPALSHDCFLCQVVRVTAKIAPIAAMSHVALVSSQPVILPAPGLAKVRHTILSKESRAPPLPSPSSF